jgi:hypothetical protein
VTDSDDGTRAPADSGAIDARVLREAATGYLIVASFRSRRHPRFAAALVDRAAALLTLGRCPLVDGCPGPPLPAEHP